MTSYKAEKFGWRETHTHRGNMIRRAQSRRKASTGQGETSRNQSLQHLELGLSDYVTVT